ncbi:alpha/beta fold hydrolase [Bacillus spizizenii]|uniref:Alpha/beta fold hydrolase n=1 Tax=Bacillus spizizenii TaxID=96241 RepID=A0A9Q4E263_BACSC|nr:alpha/beta fold hydrolase [Bacillus spizizenii]MCY8456147.1 alpha/beta fold hydrolase [Bacillus spizizenii]
MTKSSRCLLREPNPNAAARLFCFPFAGIGASAYRLWPTASEKFEICPVQLPGRENRSADLQYSEIESLSNDLLNELLPYLDRPYVIFGHCMGALIAYDLILKIMERNVRMPDHFYVSASRAPHSSHRGPVHLDLSDDELASNLLSNTSELSDPKLLSILMPQAIQLLRKDLAMCDSYQPPVRKISCPITTFAWSDDQGMPFDELLGWRGYSDVTEYLIDGDHFSVQKSANTLMPIINA